MRKLLFLAPLLFWPIELYLNNTPKDFFSYVVPMLVLLTSILASARKRYLVSVVLMCLVPLTSAKLAIIPVLYFLFSLSYQKGKVIPFVGLLFSFLFLVVQYRPYMGQTIFKTTNDEVQKLISDSHLYDSVFLARANHNKIMIVVDKFVGNITELIDINNYFFSFHPRTPVKSSQQLVKFPFMSLPLFLFAFLNFSYKKNANTLFVLIASIVGLGTLVNYDRNDFILLAPLCLIYYYGTIELETKNKYVLIYFVFFLLFSVVDLLRLFT